VRSPASDRYQSDPQFRTIVDLIRIELEAGHFTPTELREAVMLAACLYEYEHVRPIIFGDDVLRSMPGMREHLSAMMRSSERNQEKPR
jgi:hypothetical protein